MLRTPAGMLKTALQSSYKLMQILDLSCARVVSVSPGTFLSEFCDEQRSDANPVPTRSLDR